MTEMSAGRMVGLFIEMGKLQREGALGGGEGTERRVDFEPGEVNCCLDVQVAMVSSKGAE